MSPKLNPEDLIGHSNQRFESPLTCTCRRSHGDCEYGGGEDE